ASTVQHLLIAILLAAYAGTAYAAEGPFIPIDLGSLGGNASANAVNDSGRVVGVVYGAASRAFSWTPAEGMIDLGTLGGGTFDFSIAAAVNDRGQVVGASSLNGARHAISWTRADGMIDLGNLGGPDSGATAVNANGQIVGWSNVGNRFKRHAFSWTPAGGMIDLGVLGETFDLSEAVAVNDRCQVVGAR